MQARDRLSPGERHRRILVVGDDAQSVYSFRGASHLNIMGFPERFPGCRIIKLEENYRSTQAILDVGNAVLDNMSHKYEKCLRAAKKENGGKPHLFTSKTRTKRHHGLQTGTGCTGGTAPCPRRRSCFIRSATHEASSYPSRK